VAQMMSFSSPDHRLDSEYFNSPGGFAWWYTDLVNERGDGAVIIWSWGLPFLPGYANAERSGKAELPSSRPSISVAIYSKGKPAFYLLQEFTAQDASWDQDGQWQFGRSTFTTKVVDGVRTLHGSLDLDIPGTNERLQGEYRLTAPARKELGTESRDPTHDWSPLSGPAQASLQATIGDEEVRIDGRGYFDRNGGTRALHRLGIKDWLWGRVPLADRERIYYVLWGESGKIESHGLDILEDGSTITYPLEATVHRAKWSYTGVSYPTGLSLSSGGKPWLEVKHHHTVDEGPFYLRWIVSAETDGQRAKGIGEFVVPDNIDQDLMRPLVRMRVHDLKGPNSMWLPLFAGPAKGRVKRLVRSLVS